MHTIAHLIADKAPDQNQTNMGRPRNEDNPEKCRIYIAMAEDRIIRGMPIAECMHRYRLGAAKTVYRHIESALSCDDPMAAILRRVVADRKSNSRPRSLAS